MNYSDTYFLIGGRGFIGSMFAKYLTESNSVIKNILRGYLFNPKSLNFKENVLDNFPISDRKNIIIGFAYTSIPNTSFFDPVADFSENLYNVNCHLTFASKLPNTTYIYISSGGTVYGNVLVQQPIKKTTENFSLSLWYYKISIRKILFNV